MKIGVSYDIALWNEALVTINKYPNLFLRLFHNFPLLSQTAADFHISIIYTIANSDSNLQINDQTYL